MISAEHTYGRSSTSKVSHDHTRMPFAAELMGSLALELVTPQELRHVDSFLPQACSHTAMSYYAFTRCLTWASRPLSCSSICSKVRHWRREDSSVHMCDAGYA